MTMMSISKKLSILITLIVPVIWSSTAQAGEHWVWADQESATVNQEYTPNSNYAYSHGTSYNPNGNNLRVKRTATGQYQVIVNGYGVSKGTVHVTAYGGNNHCKVGSWGATGGNTPKQTIDVRCFNEAGIPINNKFSLLFYDINSPASSAPYPYSMAYLWANNPSSTSSYTPSMAYQYNSRGATNTVRRLSTGYYEVTMPKMQRTLNTTSGEGGTIAVTAYGSSSHQCKVRNWFMSSDNLKAYVDCFNSAGQAADSAYTISFDRGYDGIYQDYAYVWANQPTLPNSTPASSYAYSSSQGSDHTITMQRTAVGNYTVKLPTGYHYPGLGSNVQVTSYGSAKTYCNVNYWGKNTIDGIDINVGCYNDRGVATDSQFVLQYKTRNGWLI